MRQVIRNVVNGALKPFGLVVTRRAEATSPDEIAVKTVKEAEYYTRWSMPFPLFTPWVGHPEFQPYYEGVAKQTLVSADRCYLLVAFASHARHLPGDFAECGVYRGGTALLLSRVLRGSGKRLNLFDSFAGLPAENPDHDNTYKRGDFANSDQKQVESLLADFRHDIAIFPGWIPSTFDPVKDRTFSFAHIDVDLYQSARDCCDFFYPRMVAGGVMIFDDYGFPACRGEKDAVDEYFADKPEKPIALPSGQGLVLKLRNDFAEWSDAIPPQPRAENG
jgi:O-methyltransferase